MPRNVNARQLQEDARLREERSYKMLQGEKFVQISAGPIVLYGLTNYGHILVNECPFPGGALWNLLPGPKVKE